jgi:DNA-directed RNA polymerase specialized sigma24 family protein
VPELATELGIPFETARSRLRLGVQKLRDQIRRRGAP